MGLDELNIHNVLQLPSCHQHMGHKHAGQTVHKGNIKIENDEGQGRDQ